MTRNEILAWLTETNDRRLETLWQRADAARRDHVGDAVHLRGLIELSNHCIRQCGYCGLRASNGHITRYRMTADEILDAADHAKRLGYGTVVMQSGEDWDITADWLADVIRRIKQQTGLAITLSLGERDDDELALWRQAGADRYLLRFETSNRELYERIHPPRNGKISDRIAILRRLRDLGYETGSGVLIGIPGQTWDDLANDIHLFGQLDLDMIGVGPYIPHPDTPLAQQHDALAAAPDQQVPNTEDVAYKVIALTRLVCPDANIPSTTALATLNRESGRELGLMRGANVVMPNVTPVAYRELYEIYPAKACVNETADACHGCLHQRLRAIGRNAGDGPGHSPRYQARRAQNTNPGPPNHQAGHPTLNVADGDR